MVVGDGVPNLEHKDDRWVNDLRKARSHKLKDRTEPSTVPHIAAGDCFLPLENGVPLTLQSPKRKVSPSLSLYSASQWKELVTFSTLNRLSTQLALQPSRLRVWRRLLLS